MSADGDAEDDAAEVGAWLWDNREQFAPLRILRVTPAVVVDESDETAIELTVVLDDPDDLDEGWPVDATFAIYGAVQDRAARTGSALFVYVRFRPGSSEAAA